MISSVARTKNFLVRNMSRNAAQKGLSDHAMPMLPVTSAISVSECPRFLNIVPTTQIAIANGIPSDRYDVGTHRAGWRTRSGAAFMGRDPISQGGGAGKRKCRKNRATPENGRNVPTHVDAAHG